ncbi:hypothetical protein [Pueribacillus sp. YX66]|uniref:hypothetical protein n=1 Tax=Pueribacillus sp. YX66 TaxID=3229242 RepID=UPI00358D64E5
MVKRTDKWAVIRNFAMTGVQDAGRIALLGFLAGRLERVSFVKSLERSNIGVRMSTKRFGIWPRISYMGFIHDVQLPDPFLFIAGMADSDETIDVLLEFDGAEQAEWFQNVLVDSAADKRLQPKEQVENLRHQIDQMLDIYSNIQQQLKEGAGEMEKDLKKFLDMAEQDMARLNREINKIEEQKNL